jgi:hypothetical protein
VSDRLETSFFTVTLEDGILIVRARRCGDVGLREAREVIEAERQVAAGKRRPTLIELGGMTSVDRAARQYFAGPETAAVESAAALIVTSSLSQAIGNFFLAMSKPLTPTRLFTNTADAISWLQTFMA